MRLWVDGTEAFRRLEKLVRTARHHIIIQMFIWKSDPTGTWLAQLLLEAADRGVNVDITKEAVGDFFEFRGDFLRTKGSSAQLWKRFWNHPRIRISYSTNNDHTKVFVIDEHTLLLTGMNVADEYRYHWHDYMIELRGEGFVKQFLTRSAATDPSADIRLVMNTEERKDIRAAVLELLRSARDHVVLEQCYLSDAEIIDTLVALTKRGVKVVVIFPKRMDFHNHANMTAIGRMLSESRKHNLRILIYPESFHAKSLLVDHDTAFIGSANLFRASLDEMGEVNVLVQGKSRFLWKLREAMRQTILRSKPIDSRPPFLWISRWLAWLGL